MEAFRPYLLSAVRNVFYDIARRCGREQAVDDLGPYEPEVPFVDPALVAEESPRVASAFDAVTHQRATTLEATLDRPGHGRRQPNALGRSPA